ncbi:histidine kinase [Tenacibaculum skagerrakense]|uniref:Histidine kinase n=1 Tax=Tenacibaculum skagerrakense TaxID=186571 RepID=A0A4R2P001_9FLAO|nr:histidine kinase [Tenacibaculum skagerrakense]TCP27939.1 histidine kinase [Tenacibaculum skagerrakense]
MNLYTRHIIKNNHNILAFNAILWLFYFTVLLVVFSDFPIEKIDIIYTVSYLLTLVPAVSIAIYYLLPTFLKKGKYVVFSIFLLGNILFFSSVNILTHNHVLDFLFPEYYFISYFNAFKTVLLFFGVISFAVLVKLFEDWLYLNQREKVMLQLELTALKNQINPHFLFNALNVVYSLSINKKEETTNAILNLSDILRYVIYEATDKKITIQKEIALIKSYIDFEKKRTIANSKVDFTYSVDKEIEIYPMLLLPILENAFKHGLKSGVENPYINVNLIVNENQLLFEVENNFIPLEKEDNHFSGVGIQNVQKHLEILYPKKHDFKIRSEEAIYKTTLSIIV